ncbi:MAG: hypothetical protein AB7Q00_14540 [Phycisphaerales bacterium]
MSSSDTPKTVILKGSPPQSEALAATSSNIKPGMLLERTSAGTVRPNTTMGAKTPALFAREFDLGGNSIDDVYENADTVLFVHAQPGDQIYAFLAQGEDTVIGTMLQCNGAGALEPVDSDGIAVAVAVEALDNSPGSGIARLKVEVV